MKLYEYQAKEILHKYNINVPKGEAVTDVEGATKIYNQLGTERCVIKSQVLAGGRGKGGGVRIVNTLEEVKDYTSKIIGSHLITSQTGEKGVLVNKVLVAEAIDIKKRIIPGNLNRQECIKNHHNKQHRGWYRNRRSLFKNTS
ncbi:MAG: succinyl CoA-synthetase subunit b [Candidatus Scalindua brodae]|uniref:Succinyl CoA-synthetase subunit b n=1 Tax=Candidatus Scalindua brodae TaxID=237368 RepID=A0A0B0EK97_9BACT|nr:MAG: succinyl CoA-synthetase subunit b [Candidatus Scalindua brodae]